jgi:transcriptional regulator with XRE-family HTH domain
MDIPDPKGSSVDVGLRLHDLRLERGLSMRAVARGSGLSTNALSMIERGRTSPSVSTLYKIADALNVPITAFFRVEAARQDVVFTRQAERNRVEIPRGVWEGLGGEIFTGGVEPFQISLEAGASSGRFGMTHGGHEFVYCLEGQIEYEVEGRRYMLDQGDTLLFAAQLRHRWRNPGKSLVRAMVVLCGFEKYEHPGEFHLSAGGAEEAAGAARDSDGPNYELQDGE